MGEMIGASAATISTVGAVVAGIAAAPVVLPTVAVGAAVGILGAVAAKVIGLW